MSDEKTKIRTRRTEVPIIRRGRGAYACVTFFVGALSEAWFSVIMSMN